MPLLALLNKFNVMQELTVAQQPLQPVLVVMLDLIVQILV